MKTCDIIKNERLKANLTQEELAKKLGLQKSAIAKYENGRVKNIKRSTLEKMSTIFNCKPSYLMGLEEDTLSDNNAIELAKIASNKRMVEYFNKLNNLSEDQMNSIFNLIDTFNNNNK